MRYFPEHVHQNHFTGHLDADFLNKGDTGRATAWWLQATGLQFG